MKATGGTILSKFLASLMLVFAIFKMPPWPAPEPYKDQIREHAWKLFTNCKVLHKYNVPGGSGGVRALDSGSPG